MTDQPASADFRSGFASIVGRPNAGKSTLINALVGQKIAIASDRPQTTRHTIRGVVNRPGAQLILVDTPGLHRPRTLLGERLNAQVREAFSEVDLVACCLPSNQRLGPGDRYLVEQLAGLKPRPQLVALATKTDLVSEDRLRQHLLGVERLGHDLELAWDHIVPVSALTGFQVDLLADLLVGLLPSGPAYYPDGQLTDEPTETLVAELIREAALELVDDELPHSIAVEIDEMGPRAGRPPQSPLLDIYASLVVERDSQKPIVIGQGGQRLKQIGSTARRQIARLLGTPVYLNLQVRVLKRWQTDAKLLRRLGF
ncbi:MAG: GTPase Era [Propionibacteriaceae bacterium]|jgi:GTP-binding protein Era|nr:GTPase Era [Propionibacteriaceae bacterium]